MITSLIILIVALIIIISMSKKSRNQRKQHRRESDREHIHEFMEMVPSLCKGKTLEKIIAEYCTMLKKENQITYLRSIYTKEELNSIILL